MAECQDSWQPRQVKKECRALSQRTGRTMGRRWMQFRHSLEAFRFLVANLGELFGE